MLGNRSRVAVVAALVIAAGSLGAPAAVAHDSKGGADNPKGGADRQLAEVRKANKEFKDINVALAAGYEPAGDCVPGMGFHFVNFAQFGAMDPMVPDAVLYEADKKGRMKLVALEWFKVDADQDLSTSDDRPTMFGKAFDGPMPGHTDGMPVHYDLHAYLWHGNSDGVLATFNHKVECP